MTTDPHPNKVTLTDRLQYTLIRGILGLLHVFPYKMRVHFMGRFMQHVIGPLAGYKKRVHDNLTYVMPELSQEEREDLARKVTNNVGRTLAELFSPKDFSARTKQLDVSGPGLKALDEARESGRPVIFLSGHFGNYDALRSTLIARGFPVGGLYRRMENPLFHKFYVNNISTIGTPLFQRGRSGLGQMLRHFKQGGCLAALVDVRATEGVQLTYFGKPAWTAISLAELAVKYDALLVPCYATRQADGVSFKGYFEEPITPGEPADMIQAYNDSLEAQVRRNPGQWFWIHRRWKDAPEA